MRKHELEAWLERVLHAPVALTPASADASFRQYWRLAHDGRTLIAVDAPPPQEDTARFAGLARALRQIGLNTPEILAEDHDHGFLLVSDLGTRSYLDVLDATNADRLYGDAIGALVRLQAAGPPAGLLAGLPVYDAAFLRRELALFPEWLIIGLLRLDCTAAEQRMLAETGEALVASALEQPRVCVHRDFHSRNLMHTPIANPGILDFQDAVLGPVTYDLVSLLRDCYIAWPRARVEDWALGYFNLAVQSGVLQAAHESDLLRWFDRMGAQRHLKAAGIFARLALRDGKTGYLADLPRTLGYVVEVGDRDPILAGLGAFVSGRVLPGLAALPG